MYSKRVEKILSFGVIKFNNKLFCILLIFALFFSFSSVCASDVNDNETVGISDYSINQSGASSVSSDRVVSNISNTSHVNEVLSVANSDSDDVLGASGETGCFSDVYHLSLGTMILYADYTYNSETDSDYENGFNIDKTITIDGNDI